MLNLQEKMKRHFASDRNGFVLYTVGIDSYEDSMVFSLRIFWFIMTLWTGSDDYSTLPGRPSYFCRLWPYCLTLTKCESETVRRSESMRSLNMTCFGCWNCFVCFKTTEGRFGRTSMEVFSTYPSPVTTRKWIFLYETVVQTSRLPTFYNS